MIYVPLYLAICFVANSNGANHNFEGVASLFECRLAPHLPATRF